MEAPKDLTEALRQVASYRAIFDNAESCIFVYDCETGAIVDVNPKACAVYGYSAEEMRRLTADELSSGVPPYTGADAMRLIERARRGEVVRGEWHRRNKDGGLHWDEITLKKVEIAGRPRIMAATREITQRKAAEEALRASEEQYRAIFNVSEDALVLRDADFRIVDVNPAYENAVGRKREEVLGRRDVIVGFLGTTADYLELHQRVLEGGRERLEAEGVLRDGSHVHVELLMMPMQYRGAPHVLYVGRNITERRQAEEALRASEEQYRAIFNASADALVLRDTDFRIVDVNPAYEAMSGKRRSEVIGQTALTVSARDVGAERLQLHAVALGGKPVHFETDGRRPDGTPFVLEVRDLWPDSIAAVGAMRSSWLLRCLGWIERRMYAAATRIVTVGRGYQQELEARGVAGAVTARTPCRHPPLRCRPPPPAPARPRRGTGWDSCC